MKLDVHERIKKYIDINFTYPSHVKVLPFGGGFIFWNGNNDNIYMIKQIYSGYEPGDKFVDFGGSYVEFVYIMAYSHGPHCYENAIEVHSSFGNSLNKLRNNRKQLYCFSESAHLEKSGCDPEEIARIAIDEYNRLKKGVM